MRNAELYAAQGVRFDQVDEFPGNHSGREFPRQAANHIRRSNAVQQAPGGSGQAHVHLGDAQFDGLVGTMLGEVNIIDANDLAPAGVDDLLV